MSCGGARTPSLRYNNSDYVSDEEARRAWLRRVFASEATKRIIANLYAQASGL
jgi:hypothetical protein